jgi:hypothetical protein
MLKRERENINSEHKPKKQNLLLGSGFTECVKRSF